jgi:hypothetical protein
VSGVHFWLVSYTAVDRTTGGAIGRAVVVRAPTAADALTMFEVEMRSAARGPSERYYRGAESIRLATELETLDRELRIGGDYQGTDL